MSERREWENQPAENLRAAKDPFEESAELMKGASKSRIDLALSSIKLGSSVVSLMSGLLAAVLILYSSYVLYDTFSTSYRAYTSSWDLLRYKPEIADRGAEPSGGTETLAEIIKDYRGWLTVYDTGIDYPLVQADNNLDYASHDIYGNVSLTGAIYMDAGNTRDGSDSYNIIYGHHMDNGAMFGALDQFRKKSFYDAHREGILVTESGAYDITAIAAVRTDAYENRVYTVGNRAPDVIRFLDEIFLQEGTLPEDESQGDERDESGSILTQLYQYSRRDALSANKIVALSTCRDATTNGRLVVFFKMTPRALPTVTPVPTATPTPEPEATPEETPDATAAPAVTAAPAPTRAPSAPVPTQTPEQGPFDLEIRYEFLDGRQAAPSWKEQLLPGDPYYRENPEIPGYKTARLAVHGEMGTQPILIVVLYIPEEIADGVEVISIDDYEVPLGLDNLHAQMGVCVE